MFSGNNLVLNYCPDFFEDERGHLFTIWDDSKNQFGIDFNHDKVAKSKKNVLRGLHGDPKSWKLITCLSGEIFFVVVDYRKESDTYLKHQTFLLNDKNKKIVLVPPNFLNGHLVLSDDAVFFYKWSYVGEYPDVNSQFSIKWDDPKINIKWPISNPILSDRDLNCNYIS
jgi:dTDP-4-dehydrorhamnose 3,5-epimerase